MSDLGPNWTTSYTGKGSMPSAGPVKWNDGDPLVMHSIELGLSETPKPAERITINTQFGVRVMEHECAICHRRWQAGDQAVSHNGGPFMHKHCLERLRSL